MLPPKKKRSGTFGVFDKAREAVNPGHAQPPPTTAVGQTGGVSGGAGGAPEVLKGLPVLPPGFTAPSETFRSQGQTQLPAGYSQRVGGVGEQMQQMQEGDLSGPGAAERFQAGTEGYYTGPGRGELNISGMMPQIGRQGYGQQGAQNILTRSLDQMGGANPTAQAYSSFQSTRPDIAADPGLESYYANAQRQALEGINQNAAARGTYGSSAALAEGSEAITNLAAERAGREADYGLQRLGEQRQWEGLGGQLAGQQSASQLGWATGGGQLGLGGEQLGLGRETAFVDAAGQLQQLEQGRLGQGFDQALAGQSAQLARLGQGFDQAVQGQSLRDGRIQGMLDNQFRREQLYAPILSAFPSDVLGQDADLMGASLGGGVAAAQETVAQQQRRAQQARQDISTVIEGGKMLAGGGGGAPAGGIGG